MAQPLKHILIGGSSFCGSTLLGLVLGQLEGVVNVGESHWLAYDKTGKLPADGGLGITAENVQEFNHCHYCGQDCQVWDVPFRQALQADQGEWFQRLAARTNTHTLVSSEKETITIGKFSQTADFNLLISFKTPHQFVHSWTKRPYKHKKVKAMLNYWSRTYQDLLDLPIGGKKVVMRYTAFQDQPLPVLRQLCSVFELPFDAAALQYWKGEQHYIGGNFDVYGRLKQEGAQPLRIRPHQPVVLAEDMNKQIAAHDQAMKVFERLKELEIQPQIGLLNRLRNWIRS